MDAMIVMAIAAASIACNLAAMALGEDRERTAQPLRWAGLALLATAVLGLLVLVGKGLPA